MNIICFLTLRPNKLFYDFCKTLMRDNYEIYICIDDNSYNIPDYDNIIKIIKVDNQECENAGFKNSVLYFKNRACSRDKALYYFCKNDMEYKYIWFIEEDVFLPTKDIINNLDNKYPEGDLLCREHRSISLNNYKGTRRYIYQDNIFKFAKNDPNFPFANLLNNINIGQKEYTVGMICVVRLSKKLMNIINNFATQYKTLFIDEALFSTLSYKNNLSVVLPGEFNTLLFKKDWRKHDININNLYHPIKDINLHYEYRNTSHPHIKPSNPPTPTYKNQPMKITKRLLYYR